MTRLKLLVPMMLTFALAANGFAQISNKDDISDDIHPERAAAIREYQKADEELNAIYKMLMDIYDKHDHFDDKKEGKARLKETQLAWIKYRDLAVKSETYLRYSHEKYYMSMAELTRQRIARLKDMLEYMREGIGGAGPYNFMAPAKEALDKILKIEAGEKTTDNSEQKMNTDKSNAGSEQEDEPGHHFKFSSVLPENLTNAPQQEKIKFLIKFMTEKTNGYEDRGFAAMELGKIGKPSIPSLLEVLKSGEMRNRELAAYSLGYMRSKANEAVPALIKALQNEKEGDALTSEINALGEIGQEAKLAVPALIKIGNADAVKALGNIGLGAKEAIPFLETKWKDTKENTNYRRAVITALVQITRDLSPLVHSMADPNAQVRYESALAMKEVFQNSVAARYGLNGKTAVPELIRLLKDCNSDVRYNTADALGAIGPDAAPATSALIEAMSDADANVRDHVVSALGEIGPGANQAVPKLIEILKNAPENERKIIVVEAVVALGNIGPMAKDALTYMIKIANNQHFERGELIYVEQDRKDFRKAIGNIDPAALKQVKTDEELLR